MKISLKIILSVLFLTVFAGGGLWYFAKSKAPAQEQVIPVTDNQDQQTSEDQSQELSTEMVARNLDVSTWRTYRNEEYGIEFKYPEEMFNIKDDSVDYSSVDNSNGSIGLRIWLTQKGYSIDDETHRFIVSLSLLKSLGEYYVEKEGVCRFVNIAEKKGKICTHNEYKEFQNTSNRYLTFIDKGSCSGEFIVRFDEKKLKFGDFESAVTVGCNNDFGINEIYHSIYQSIQFFPSNTSGR